MIENAATTGEIIIRLLIALLGGSLIGLERERARFPETAKDVPGLRTFGLLAMYGSLLGIVSSSNVNMHIQGLLLAVIVFSGALGYLTLYIIYVYQRLIKKGYTGLTTFIVMLLTFIIGFFSGIGYIIESAGASILVTLVLSLKGPIERVVLSISYNELISLLEISTLALVVGPIISAMHLVVFGIDIFKVYIFFVIILTLSFISYLASKVAGTKGFKIASILSGLVNSEAAISASSEIVSSISDEEKRASYAGTAAALIISSMEARTVPLILIAIYIFTSANLSLRDLVLLLIPLVPPLLVILLAIKKELPVEGFHPQSPLSFKTALKTVIAYLVLTFTIKLTSFLGENLSILVAAIGGLANAGASILGLASSYPQIPLAKIIAGSLLSMSAASINKIIYADVSLLGKKAWIRILMWSLMLSLTPLIIGLLYIL